MPSSYSIELHRDLSTRLGMFRAGRYRVPKEMPQRVAERALAGGIAEKVMPRVLRKKAGASA